MSEKLLQADNGVTTLEGEGSAPSLVQEAPLLPDAPQMGTFDAASEPGEARTFILDETDLVADDAENREDATGEKPAVQMAAISDEALAAMVRDEIRMRVDALAPKLVERIAWEVVPELAESLEKEEIRNLKLPRA
ncbi:MAG: hypothetical protein IJS21_04895 [Deltaproteobacteria bacterium]|nr:hypothetical protein [Deltaproteobacteria bacterium]